MHSNSVTRWARCVVLGLSLAPLALGAAQEATPGGSAQSQGGSASAPRPAPAGAQQPRAGGAPPSKDSFKFGSPPALPEGMTEEQMWPAATAEGWAKPCLIPWQRSFDDALAVSKATGAPIMVCVNMDGEIASEHFAGVRYRDPETAKALEPYVCVIASVYRHTPRDYDEQGRRVPCPRFGTVTCGEHIVCETELYAKYFEGQRVSPRHIALELDGSELFDVYYSWDTQTVFTAYKAGVEGRPAPLELARDGIPMPERVASADALDRAALETAYIQGTREQRLALLRAAAEKHTVDQNDLLRLAIFGLDVELARVARSALTRNQSEAAVDLIADALKVPMDASERDALVAAAEKLGEKYPRGRTLAALHKGLALGSSWIDAAGAAATSASSREYAESVERRADAAHGRPADPQAKLELAEALLARAQETARDRRYVRWWLEDARRNAEEARELGLASWRLDATLAAIYDQLGEANKALERAVAAVEGGMWSAQSAEMSATDAVRVRVLALFAQSRQLAIRKAYRENSKWPPEWLADVNAAYAALAVHPLVTDENLVSYYDFLRWLGGAPRANAVLDEALKRFPDSALLHDRLRSRILWERGPEGLESEYSKRLEAADASPQLSWFAGYAALVAAEHFRRRSEFEKALAAYARGIGLYERNVAALPAGRDLCDHFIALAHAGRSRVALGQGALGLATDELLACFARRADSAATPDGLNITPIDTAKMLQAKLGQAGDGPRGATLQAALDALDPKLLEPPPSETRVPPRAGNRPQNR
ncbi:MAG: hypothetical protein IT454_20255 [Planctomycetes bacterium]|nr:hypothetical protein [Planctomycetota bacterium]